MFRSVLIAAALMIPTSAFAADCWTSGPNSFVSIGEVELIAGERVCQIQSIEVAGNHTIYRAGCVADEFGEASFVEIIKSSDTTATVEWDAQAIAEYRRCPDLDSGLFTRG
jgi:hypothetical protein